jgi:hypothetical protein
MFLLIVALMSRYLMELRAEAEFYGLVGLVQQIDRLV